MASLHSVTAPMLPSRGSLIVEWTIDKKTIQAAVSDAISSPIGLIPPLVSVIVDYLKAQKEETDGVFGEKEWTDYFGRVPPAPAYPPGIEEIWRGPCPIFPEKKVNETHLFVYLPATVNGQPLTLKSLRMLAEQHFSRRAEVDAKAGTEKACGLFHPEIETRYGDQPIGNSCWVLMTNKCLPNSQLLCFSKQQLLIDRLVTRSLLMYEVPKILDAAVCLLARFVSSKIRLFNQMSTRCQEGYSEHFPLMSMPYQLTIGSFDSEGLRFNINYRMVTRYRIGIAALRKFS